MRSHPFFIALGIIAFIVLISGSCTLADSDENSALILQYENQASMCLQQDIPLPPVAVKHAEETFKVVSTPYYSIQVPSTYTSKYDTSHSSTDILTITPDTSYTSLFMISRSKKQIFTSKPNIEDFKAAARSALQSSFGASIVSEGLTTLGGQQAVYFVADFPFNGDQMRMYHVTQLDSSGYLYSVNWIVDPYYYSSNLGSATTVINTFKLGSGGSGSAVITPTLSAKFSVDKTTGKVPLEVVFTDKSSGDADSYLYEFGDGATSTEQSPTHTYYQVGNYIPKLTIKKNGMTKTTVLERKISVTGVSTELWGIYKKSTSTPKYYFRIPTTLKLLKTSSNQDSTITTFSDSKNGYLLIIAVIKTDFSGSGLTLDNLETVFQDYAEENGGYVIESNQGKLGGNKAMTFISTQSTDDGLLYTTYSLATWSNGRIVMVQYVAPTKTWENGLPTGMTAISTFKFI